MQDSGASPLPPPAPSGSGPPGIALDGVGLSYAGQALFRGLSMRLEAGRCTALLGPSGIGKSTLLRLIAGLAPPGTTGTVTATDAAPLAGRVAYMAQQDLLLPWASVLDNVLIGRRLRGERRGAAMARQRALDLLDRVGLAAAAALRPAALSGGMRQRVALARTLLEDRPVVLMDEPFSALDAITRWELQAVAARLLEGRTVLLVTHDPLEALRLAHRIHVMAGRPAVLGPPLQPEGRPARPLDDPALLALQAELLGRLAAARIGNGPTMPAETAP